MAEFCNGHLHNPVKLKRGWYPLLLIIVAPHISSPQPIVMTTKIIGVVTIRRKRFPWGNS